MLKWLDAQELIMKGQAGIVAQQIERVHGHCINRISMHEVYLIHRISLTIDLGFGVDDRAHFHMSYRWTMADELERTVCRAVRRLGVIGILD